MRGDVPDEFADEPVCAPDVERPEVDVGRDEPPPIIGPEQVGVASAVGPRVPQPGHCCDWALHQVVRAVRPVEARNLIQGGADGSVAASVLLEQSSSLAFECTPGFATQGFSMCDVGRARVESMAIPDRDHAWCGLDVCRSPIEAMTLNRSRYSGHQPPGNGAGANTRSIDSYPVGTRSGRGRDEVAHRPRISET